MTAIDDFDGGIASEHGGAAHPADEHVDQIDGHGEPIQPAARKKTSPVLFLAPIVVVAGMIGFGVYSKMRGQAQPAVADAFPSTEMSSGPSKPIAMVPADRTPSTNYGNSASGTISQADKPETLVSAAPQAAPSVPDGAPWSHPQGAAEPVMTAPAQSAPSTPQSSPALAAPSTPSAPVAQAAAQAAPQAPNVQTISPAPVLPAAPLSQPTSRVMPASLQVQASKQVSDNDEALRAQLKAAQEEIATLQSEVATKAELAKAHASAIRPASLAPARPMPRPAAKHAAAKESGPVVRRDFSLYAVKDGMAYVYSNADHQTYPVYPGSMMPDGTTVKSIDEENFKMLTSAGTVVEEQVLKSSK